MPEIFSKEAGYVVTIVVLNRFASWQAKFPDADFAAVRWPQELPAAIVVLHPAERRAVQPGAPA
jgi:hypothetical protein